MAKGPNLKAMSRQDLVSRSTDLHLPEVERKNAQTEINRREAMVSANVGKSLDSRTRR